MSRRSPSSPSDERTDYGRVHWLRGVLRRRIYRLLLNRTVPGLELGRLCDVRRGITLRIRRGASVSFGPGCVLDEGMTVEVRGRLEVGSRTIFGHHCTVAAADAVTIGQDCLIAELVSIRDHDHEFADVSRTVREQGRRTAPIHIGNNVWIGAKVTVTAGVTIGDGAVIGANAVVTRDVPAHAIAVGIPARVVRSRADSTAE